MRLILALVLFAAGLAHAQLKPWNGGPTPPFGLQTLDGRNVRLEDYRGKVLLVNFWATWCEPCREEMPSMNRLRAAFAGRPFEVLAVNFGEAEPRIKRFLEELPLDFPVLLDRNSAVAKAWRVRVLPASFLIGPDGRIRYAVIGEFDWSGDAARKAVTTLLPPEPTQPRAALSTSFR
jgi:peroxiredoxin